jgi:hypothetical protein
MTLLKPPDKDPWSDNVIRYDPKRFRGSKSPQVSRSASWYLRLFLVFVGVAVFLLYLDSSHVRPYLFELLGLRDTRTEIRNASNVTASGEIVKNAILGSKSNSKPCTKLDETKADDGDIADYLRRSNVLLEKISETEQKFETIKNINSKIELHNALVRDAGMLTDFYNQKLVRCYTNTQDVIAVSKRADTLKKSLDALSAKVR